MSVKTIIENTTKWMEQMARDDTHGYDQIYRWEERGDYDCSAAVITAYEQAGVPVKTRGATYTGDMLDVFVECGFTDVTSSVNRSSGHGLQRGDVLLNTVHHTAIYCGNGLEVEASINEMGTATGGKPGDQTGREFLIRSYRNYPWTNILRYTGGKPFYKDYLSIGDRGDAVKTMQTMLIACGYSCGPYGADGDFGDGTEAAVRKFQKENDLAVDGQYGPASKAKLEELYHSHEDPEQVEKALHYDAETAGAYTTVSDLWMKTGAGIEKTEIVVVPEGGVVHCYGYYNMAPDGNRWLLVTYKKWKGYCSARYLEKE